MKSYILLLIVTLLLNLKVSAQEDIYANTYNPDVKKIVMLDPVSQMPLGNIPFDRIFYFRVYQNDSSKLPEFAFLLNKDGTPVYKKGLNTYIVEAAKNQDDPYIKKGYHGLDIMMPALDPNKNYQLLVADMASSAIVAYALILEDFSKKGIPSNINTIYDNSILKNQNIRAKKETLIVYYKLHKNKIDQFSNANDFKGLTDYLNSYDDNGESVALFKGGQTQTFGTYQSNIETSSLFNLVADGGIVSCGFQKDFTSITPYLGINYSFRSLDSEVPFHYLRKRLKFYQRLAIHVGLTLNTLGKDDHRSNLFGTNNLILGGGYKFSHVVSITAGALFFNKVNPNPLLDQKKISAVPYLGLSANLKIKAALGDLGKALGIIK
jgi:hypothetical protein